MTRRIDWRDGATRAERRKVDALDVEIAEASISRGLASAARKRLISRCYQKAARAAKRGK